MDSPVDEVQSESDSPMYVDTESKKSPLVSPDNDISNPPFAYFLAQFSQKNLCG